MVSTVFFCKKFGKHLTPWNCYHQRLWNEAPLSLVAIEKWSYLLTWYLQKQRKTHQKQGLNPQIQTNIHQSLVLLFKSLFKWFFFQYLFWFQKAGKRNISNLQYLIRETTIFVSNFYKSIGLRWKSMMKSLYFLNQPFLLEFDGRNYYLSQ